MGVTCDCPRPCTPQPLFPSSPWGVGVESDESNGGSSAFRGGGVTAVLPPRGNTLIPLEGLGKGKQNFLVAHYWRGWGSLAPWHPLRGGGVRKVENARNSIGGESETSKILKAPIGGEGGRKTFSHALVGCVVVRKLAATM